MGCGTGVLWSGMRHRYAIDFGDGMGHGYVRAVARPGMKRDGTGIPAVKLSQSNVFATLISDDTEWFLDQNLAE